jgi:hypothetical protein
MWKKLFLLLILVDLFIMPQLIIPIIGVGLLCSGLEAWFNHRQQQKSMLNYYGESLKK